MCTYDYTPYRGCVKGQQHFYLQWMKCNKALENGNRHCPLSQSVEVEELKKLSGNVLFCPLDNPIAVQQHEFLFLTGDEQDEQPKKPRPTEDSRARSRSARSTRGRPTTIYSADRSSDNSFGERVRRTARKKAPRSLSSQQGPDSDCSDSPVPRPKTASGVKRLDDHKVLEDNKILARTRSHRRASSVEWAPLPTVKVTHPRPSDDDREARPTRSDPATNERETAPKQPVPPGPLSPGMRARLGLPASPDMHRRGSMIQRSRSESPLKAEFQFPADGPATDPEFGHPLFTQGSSPEQKSEPFAAQPPVRRARTSRARSRTSEESMMRRIVEDRRAEEEATTRLMPTPKREVKMMFPDHEHQPDQAVGLGLGSMPTDGKRLTRAKSEARIAAPKSPGLTADLPPPQRSNKSSREVLSTSNIDAIASKTASSEPPTSDNAPFSYVNTSIRASRTAPDEDEKDAARILQQKREARKSRRYEEQVAEAKKWAAARDQHFSASVPSLPAAYDKNYLPPHQSPPEPSWLGGPRQSNDSGYLSQSQSGQHQGKPQVPQRRNTLHKAQHKSQMSSTSTATTVSMAQSESTVYMEVGNMKAYQELATREPMAAKQEVVHVTALPTQVEDVAAQDGGKGSLLKRMGLKRKISSLWERNGSVNGAAAVAG